MTRVLVAGGGGQVGGSIAALARDPQFAHLEVTIANRAELDITDRASIDAVMARVRPQAVINAAAYTAVDAAEANEDDARAINADAVALLADACMTARCRLLHLSTDYVFDGTKSDWYVEEDPIAPLGAYGRSKAAGETAARACDDHLILRTSWVYASHGNNFVRTMLRLGAERDELRVVADQIGCPTNALDIADGLLRLVDSPGTGTFHLAGADATTWHEFATAIFDIAGLDVSVEPIGTVDFPTPAPRPANSRLDSSALADVTGVRLPSWRDALPPVIESLLDTERQEPT